jgi:Putative peptidoglycan binding domain
MNRKSFLVCFIVLMMATSVAMAGGRHGNFGGGFARGGSFHRGNWNHHCHGGRSSFVFTGSFGFPYFGYPYGYGYYPYGYGYNPYGYGYGSGYYGYGAGYYGNGYYGNRYYGSNYYRGYGYNGYQSSVARLQQQLSRAGYYRGSIDGIMGPRTRYALRAYQHDHGTASL